MHFKLFQNYFQFFFTILNRMQTYIPCLKMLRPQVLLDVIIYHTAALLPQSLLLSPVELVMFFSVHAFKTIFMT